MFFLFKCFTEHFQELAFSRRCEWYPFKRWQLTRAAFLQVPVTPCRSRSPSRNIFTFCHLLSAITRRATIRCDKGMCNYKKCRTSGCRHHHRGKARYYGNINLACPCSFFFFFFFMVVQYREMGVGKRKEIGLWVLSFSGDTERNKQWEKSVFIHFELSQHGSTKEATEQRPHADRGIKREMCHTAVVVCAERHAPRVWNS